MTPLVRYNLGEMQKGTVISIEGHDHKFKKSNNRRKELFQADSCASGDQFYTNLHWLSGIFSCCNHSGKLRCKGAFHPVYNKYGNYDENSIFAVQSLT
jgi:hypothetical protein